MLWILIIRFQFCPTNGMWEYHVQIVQVILRPRGNVGLHQTGGPFQYKGKIHMLMT